jgi:citrate lyase beta subunit
MTVRPRRSVLYMPGSNARALEKARELPADCLILDLEDAVAPDAKAQARDAIVKALENGFGDREVMVRINGLDTRWWVDDLNTVLGGPRKPDAILVPKISDPNQLEDLAARFVDLHTDPHVRVWAMMETPLAMLNAQKIAAAALDTETRLSGFVMGTNDLAKDTRARLVPGRAPMLPWLMTCVAAARAYGLSILDGVYNDLGARSRLRRQDTHPSAPDRSVQRGVLAQRRRSRCRPQDDRRLRLAGKCQQRRGADRRQDGRAPACRDGAADGGDRGCDREAQIGLKSAAELHGTAAR